MVWGKPMHYVRHSASFNSHGPATHNVLSQAGQPIIAESFSAWPQAAARRA
jgi:hypothetical protein